jgi:hypothetical protein
MHAQPPAIKEWEKSQIQNLIQGVQSSRMEIWLFSSSIFPSVHLSARSFFYPLIVSFSSLLDLDKSIRPQVARSLWLTAKNPA